MENQIFCTQAGHDFRWDIFVSTDLGQLHKAIPFSSLATSFSPLSSRGAPGFFGIEGMVALQVLKAYSNLSDDKLRQRINTDWALQF